jgi:hypothetical protein
MQRAKRGLPAVNTEERAALESQLSTTMVTQWSEFQKERRQWEEDRDAATQRKHDESAARERAKYDQLLDLQIKDAGERQKAAKLRNRLLGALIALLTTAGGSGAYIAAAAPQKVEPKEVKAAVESAKDASEIRFKEAEKKIERLGTAQVASQVAQSAGVEYIADKIDAAHPKVAGVTKEPPEVEAARVRSEGIRKKKRRAELLGAHYDPFEDLPSP